MSKSKFCVYLSKDLKENYCQRFNISENDFSVFCYAYARDNNLQEGLTDEVLNSAAFQKALNQNFGASEGHFLIEDQDAYDNAARLYEEMKEKYNMDENGNITFSEDATALFENPYNKKAIDDLLAWFRMNDNYFKDNVKVFTNSEGKLVIHVNKPLHSATAITSENVTDGNGFYSQEDVDYLSDRKISIEGEFKGSVKEALNAFKKAYREAVDKYEGKNHYSQGRETKPRRKLSSKIKNKEAYHSFISKLTDSILNKLESLGTNITIKADSSIKSAMDISIGKDGSLTLRYNPELVAMESERIDYIIAHELVHSVTSTAVNNVINGTGTATEKAFVDSIWGVITDLFNNKNFYWNFGFDIHDPANKGKYIKEFIANVMTNPDLQSRLADFKTDAKSTKTVWQRIVDAFKSLLDSFLGKDTSNTYLEQLMSTIQMHIESPSERLQKAFEEYDAFIDRQEVLKQEAEAEMQSIKDKAIADGTFMKAPNGNPTNLTERQWLQVRTKAFKEWFGDWENDPQNASKVVDENGEPLVVYHGTTVNFSSFDKNKRGKFTGSPSAKMAFFASSSEDQARIIYAGLETVEEYAERMQSLDPNLTLSDIGAYFDYQDPEDLVFDYFREEFRALEIEYEDVINEAKKLAGTEQRKSYTTANKSDEFIFNIDLNDLRKEGYIISQEQEELYNQGKDIEVYKIVEVNKFNYDEDNHYIKQLNTKRSKEYLQKYQEIEKNKQEALERVKLEKEAFYNNRVKSLFLNIRNPKIDNDYGKDYRQERYSKRIKDAVANNNDGGIILDTQDPLPTHVYYFFESNQVKSATDNIGSFSLDSNDINEFTEGIGNTDISEIINPDGSINFSKLEEVTDEYFNTADEALFNKGRKTLRQRAEKHYNKDGKPFENNTLEHIQNVVKSAIALDVREDLKPQLILAAALHDIAKPFHGGAKHGFQSVEVINQVFKGNISPLVKFAVKHHMLSLTEEAFTAEDAKRIMTEAVSLGLNPQDAIDLLLALNTADILSGRDLNDIDFYSKKTLKETIEEEIPAKRQMLEDAALSSADEFTEGGESKVEWSRESSNGFEVSTAANKNGIVGDSRFSALNARFAPGTKIEGVDVGNKTIEEVYQEVIKQSGKGKAPAEGSNASIKFITTEKDGVKTTRLQAYRKGKALANNASRVTIDSSFIKESMLPEGFRGTIYVQEVREGNSSIAGSVIIVEDDGSRFEMEVAFKKNPLQELQKPENLENHSYMWYKHLWKVWAKQNPQLIEELRDKSKGKVLTDKFANTRVSQARALSEILNETPPSNTQQSSLGDIIYLEDTVYEAAMKRYLNILSYNLTELKTVSKEELLKVISRVFKTKPKEVIENIFELYSGLNNLLKEKNITQKDYKVADNIFNAKEAGLTDEDIAKLEKIRQVFTIETENTKVLSYSEYKAFQYICDELFEIPEFADYDEEAQGYVIPEYFYDTIMLIEKLLGSKKVTPKNVEEIYHIINSDYPHVYSEKVNFLLDSFLDNTESVGSQAQSNTTTQPSAQQQTTDSSAYDHMYSFSAKEKQETIEALNEYNKEAGALGVAKPKEFVESIEQAPQKIALSEQYDEKQTKKYKTYAKIGSKNLYTIKRFIAARFTELINEFLTDPTSLERRFGPNFPIKDVTSYTREKLLAEPWLGIQILNKLIRSRFRLSEEKRNTTYADFPELIEIYDAIYNNWEDVMQEVIPLLMEREKFNPSINNEIEFSSALESDLLEAFLDAAENETQVPLAWQLGHRNRSSEMSLSATVRRALSTFPVLDENGNQVYDRELGIPLYEDERVIYNYLHKWLSRYNTKKEMLDVLRGMRGSSHSWISTLVDKLDSDPAFATLFFHNMRLDATNYSILKTEWDKEKKEYVTTNMIVNQSTPAKMIMDEVQDAFAEAAVSAGDRIDIIDSTLKGTASKYAQTLKDIRNNVLDSILKRSYSVDINDFKDAIKNKDQNLLKAIEDLSKVMNAFGIMVTPAMLRDTVLLDTEVAHAKDISLYKIISDLNTIGADIKSRYQKNSKAINIFVDKKNNKSYQAYKRIADLVAPVVKETLESSSYANGKSYYTFVPPSFLGQLMNTLRSESNTTVKELLEQEYNSEWFKLKNSNGEDTYAIAMLRELQNSIEEGSSIDRGALFDRKVQLSYNGEDYVKLTPTQYLTSIMKEFFYAPESQYAWYRVPILSNKPSSEFIKFKKYDVRTFSSNGPSVIDQLYDVFAQELKRARVVIDRAKNGLKPEELIKTYDIKSEKYAKEIEAVLKKLKAKEKITVADVVKDGKYIFFENGASFKFLDEFNRIIGENTNPELAQFLVDSIFNRNLNPEQIADKIPAVKKEIENIIASRVKNFNTYIESLGMSKNNITTMLLSQGVKIVNGTVDAMIEQFIANDMLMSINIIQLTTTDLAFYKDSIDFQKRFAQVHSPGLRLDADATFMYNGEEIEASDGYLRTIFVKDFKVKSAVIDALSAIFEARAKELEKTNKDAARDFRNMAKLAISQYEKINATDAQSLTCPSAYRKKLVMQGKWGSKEIAAFEAIKKGDLSAANLGVVFQPIKPFVFTKTNVASHSAEMPSGISVPNQQKNSEYLLFVANEIFRGQKNSTTLGKGNDALSLFKALSDYMESTHYKNGKYQKDGIDSIQFNSAVKVGEFGVIDLNKLDPNKPIESLKQIIDTNPNTYIRKFKVGDYAIQQEVPAHMQEHYQPMGSQVRALTLSDLIGNSYSISYYDPAEGTHKSISYSSSDTANLYQELIAANIQESVDALKKDLNLDVPSGLKDAKARERYINLRISELLLKEAEKDAKNGLDLKRSLLIDENGDFVIPLSDPIHSVRIQQLLNSILKKRINKQPVKGGPVVQVSSFGLSRDLKIVFKNKKGEEIAATKKEGETDAQFMSRMAEEGLSLSHYEMMITCPSKEYEEIFLNPDGTSKDIEKVLKKYPQMKGVLDALAYRIPTEDAYSVLPARVVGFLPRAAGEAAMFPVEITAITGSDFDKFMLK